MKMNLKLTADELMDVVDAAVDAARERDYMIPEEELIKDMTYIVDAALSAMGIEIVPTDEDKEEEEDEEWTPCDDCYHPNACEMCEYAEPKPEPETDPIESMIFDYYGKRAITDTVGKLLLDTCYSVVDARNPSMAFKDKVAKAKSMMTAIAKDYGIEWVTEEGE